MNEDDFKKLVNQDKVFQTENETAVLSALFDKIVFSDKSTKYLREAIMDLVKLLGIGEKGAVFAQNYLRIGVDLEDGVYPCLVPVPGEERPNYEGALSAVHNAS